MNLISESFNPWDDLDPRLAFGKHDPAEHFTLAGNRNPHLAWENVPEGTKSFALVCYDDDVPTDGTDVNQEGKTVPVYMERTIFFHWALADIPADVTSIAEGSHSDGVTVGGKPGGRTVDGAVHGVNDFTSWFAGNADMKGHYYGYDGPGPPWNDERTHAYVFHLMALDVESLGLEGPFSGVELLAAATPHVLGEAKLAGLYRINPR